MKPTLGGGKCVCGYVCVCVFVCGVVVGVRGVIHVL